MISAHEVSAVVPTRGDVDVRPVVESLKAAGFDDIVVYDNSRRENQYLYARYAAISHARHDVIVTQDDDLIVQDWAAILAAYKPGELTVSYPEPWDIPWVARGAVFDRDLPDRAFRWYDESYERDDLFTRFICDAVFALLTETVNVIDVGSTDLPHGLCDGRISTSPGWYDSARPEGQKRCEVVRGKPRPADPAPVAEIEVAAVPERRWKRLLARVA